MKVEFLRHISTAHKQIDDLKGAEKILHLFRFICTRFRSVPFHSVPLSQVQLNSAQLSNSSYWSNLRKASCQVGAMKANKSHLASLSRQY